MAEYAAEHAEVPAVRSLARHRRGPDGGDPDDGRMLAARGGTPLPAP